MTNGEKLCIDFPNMRYTISEHRVITTIGVAASFDLDWWNAEYKEPNSDIRLNRVENELNQDKNELEPTTKNDLALIHTWGLDEEIRCTMCTNSMKSDRGCDGSCVVNKGMYKAVMDAIEKRIHPTTKNDLSSGLEKNSKKLEKDFGELDCISRADVNRIICEYRDDATETGNERDLERAYGANAVGELISELPSVTPIRPKGHWIGHREHCENLGVMPSGLGAYEWCSNCDCSIDVREWHRNRYNYCPNCGADNREVVEE